MRYQAALRPDRGLASRQQSPITQAMARRPRRRKSTLLRRLTLALAIVPFAYLMAALIGSLVPVNRGWSEPDDGVTIYIANNGLHSDIVMPRR